MPCLNCPKKSWDEGIHFVRHVQNGTYPRTGTYSRYKLINFWIIGVTVNAGAEHCILIKVSNIRYSTMSEDMWLIIVQMGS